MFSRTPRKRSRPRPGLVLEVDKSTPPVVFHHGESFRLESLPANRSRIIYPGDPLPGLDDPDRSIREALESPIDSKPLRELLHADMKLTIAFDDISLPLPPMRRPDIRQRILSPLRPEAEVTAGQHQDSLRWWWR